MNSYHLRRVDHLTLVASTVTSKHKNGMYVLTALLSSSHGNNMGNLYFIWKLPENENHFNSKLKMY